MYHYFKSVLVIINVQTRHILSEIYLVKERKIQVKVYYIRTRYVHFGFILILLYIYCREGGTIDIQYIIITRFQISLFVLSLIGSTQQIID